MSFLIVLGIFLSNALVSIGEVLLMILTYLFYAAATLILGTVRLFAAAMIPVGKLCDCGLRAIYGGLPWE